MYTVRKKEVLECHERSERKRKRKLFILPLFVSNFGKQTSASFPILRRKPSEENIILCNFFIEGEEIENKKMFVSINSHKMLSYSHTADKNLQLWIISFYLQRINKIAVSLRIKLSSCSFELDHFLTAVFIYINVLETL